MKTITEDLYWLVTRYDGLLYFLIKDEDTHEWRLGTTNIYHHGDLCSDDDLIRNAFHIYQVRDILKELEGKEFTVWVYKETDYRQDKIYEQKSFVPEFKKMPVELTMKYFEE